MPADQKEIVITYETLYEIFRREKSRETLQELDRNWFSDVVSYLKQKQATYEASLAKTDMFSLNERETIATQLTSIRRLITEIYARREKKIIDITLNKARTNSDLIDTTNMLPTEEVFFEELLTLITKYRNLVLDQLVAGQQPQLNIQKKEKQIITKKTKSIKFLQNVEQFVGDEMELYGPFNKDDEAELPTALAEILVGQGSAVEQN